MMHIPGGRIATIVRGTLIAVSLSGSVAACSTDAPDACAALSGKTFVSTTTQECGLQPGTGVLMCNWELTFMDDGHFDWSPHSDTPQSGTYTCSGSVVNNSLGVTASYDSAGGVLTWENVAYTVQPQ
jgi:hypothetical protein